MSAGIPNVLGRGVPVGGPRMIVTSGNVAINGPQSGTTLTISGGGGGGGNGVINATYSGSTWTTTTTTITPMPTFYWQDYERVRNLLFKMTQLANQIENLSEEDLKAVEDAKTLMTETIVAEQEAKAEQDRWNEKMAQWQQQQLANNMTFAQPNPYAAQSMQSGTYYVGSPGVTVSNSLAGAAQSIGKALYNNTLGRMRK